MDFSRTKLLELIDKGLKNHRARYDAEEAKKAEKRAKEAATWERDHGPEWDDFITKAKAARRAVKPITACMVPKSRSRYSCSDPAFFAPSHAAAEYVPPNDLLALKALLEASTSETVSLAKIKLSNLEMIAQGAVR